LSHYSQKIWIKTTLKAGCIAFQCRW